MKMPTWDELDTLDDDQLRNLNTTIISLMRDRVSMRQMQAGRAFHIGDIVTFHSSKRGRDVLMRVGRININTLSGFEVDAEGIDTGRKWRVSSSLAKHVVKEEAPAPASVSVTRRMRLKR